MKSIAIVSGSAIPVIGNDIDTDRIIPARFLKEITFNRMGEYPFYDERFDVDGEKKDHPFNRSNFQGAEILLANANFGCGSSREHAPQSLMRWGIRAIIAESFAEIFSGNCSMLGIPTACISSSLMEEIQKIVEEDPKTILTLDIEASKLKIKDRSISIEIAETRRRALLDGTWDSTSLLMSNIDKVKHVESTLPKLIQS